MVIDTSDEILQDFLLEAGEIVELLSEQLVELEKAPEDYDLLNAIFRGFHTVKGGAGFLGIEALVGICHKAEDVFNCLRQGDRKVTQDLMDVVLQALDVVIGAFDALRAGQEPKPVDVALLQRLQVFTTAQAVTVEAPPVVLAAVSSPASVEAQKLAPHAVDDDTITEAEFDALLDVLQGKSAPSEHMHAPTVGYDADIITEAEFDDLLDTIHGKGQFSVSASAMPVSGGETSADKEEAVAKAQSQAAVVGNAPTKSVPKPAPVALDEPQQHGAAKSVPNKDPKPAAASQAENTVRVDTQVLDNIMNMVGELVLIRNRFQTLRMTLDVGEQMNQTFANLDIVTADLQLAVMKTRMQPIKKIFGRFPRVVRDLARNLNKEIRLELIGEETDLDKNLVEALADPLVHLIRNAVDHGVETPAEREAAGKPREGVIILKAAQAGDHIELSIKDDGKGMNPNSLRAKVVEKGLMDAEAAARLDKKDCFNLIFLPGFSTKTEISDVSGRGVGMDVVKTRINQMNGTVEIDSTEGVGSTIIIILPLTLAIMPTLMVKLGKQVFALPLANIIEILDLDLSKTNVVHGQLMVMVREKPLPLFYISDWLINDPSYVATKDRMGHVAVVNAGGRHVGFVVDQFLGQEEVVIKALGAKLQGLEGLSGATMTGDGKVALILDVLGLMQKYIN
jgi:two-component system, chemotaxis family, sensor kinase CheA